MGESVSEGANFALAVVADVADKRIDDIYRAFGAPGDYGYETKQGQALFELYKVQLELRVALTLAKREAS